MFIPIWLLVINVVVLVCNILLIRYVISEVKFQSKLYFETHRGWNDTLEHWQKTIDNWNETLESNGKLIRMVEELIEEEEN